MLVAERVESVETTAVGLVLACWGAKASTVEVGAMAVGTEARVVVVAASFVFSLSG